MTIEFEEATSTSAGAPPAAGDAELGVDVWAVNVVARYLPHGLNLPEGVQMWIDEGARSKYVLGTADQKGSYAVLPLSTALAAPQTSGAPQNDAEAAIEAAAEAFEARMEAFGERAEAVSEDESLSEDQREARIAAIWTEYQPQVAAFTAEITRQAGAIALAALADIDVEALVADALNDPEVKSAMEDGLANAAAFGAGVVQNSAWTNPDPEQMRTYGLIAQYALDQAADAVEDADQAAEDAEAPEAPEAPEAG